MSTFAGEDKHSPALPDLKVSPRHVHMTVPYASGAPSKSFKALSRSNLGEEIDYLAHQEARRNLFPLANSPLVDEAN